MNNVHTNNATPTLLGRILELHRSGLTTQEINDKIITSDPETAKFRSEMLIGIIIALASGHGEDKKT